MESKLCTDRLNELRDDIVRLCAPREIYLFSQKHRMSGDLCAVKLCVIIPDGDAHKIEHKLYVELESELPFDLLVYTEEEWEQLLENKMSFASHIKKSGRVLYAAD